MTIQLSASAIGQIGTTETATNYLGDTLGRTLTETLTEAFAGTSRINNVISSINAYADMSPDLSVRKEVNNWLGRRDRQSLDITTWCQLFGKGQPQHPVLAFIYEAFEQYSGLNFSRIRPNDSLNTNLQFPLVCWFDWTITFCEEFFQAFGLDLSDCFDEDNFSTIGELVDFLVGQVETVSAPDAVASA